MILDWMNAMRIVSAHVTDVFGERMNNGSADFVLGNLYRNALH